MSYQKAYTLGTNFWENSPSVASPINEDNLNATGNAINTIDNRVIELDVSKANQSDMLTAVRSVTFDSTTGIVTITQMDGTVTTYDTLLEKVAVNFDFDDDPTSAHYENLVITLDDGTVKYVDMSSLITQYEFVDSQRIGFTVGNDGAVSADIKAGSITETQLQPNYLSDITAQAASAQSSASASSQSASAASASAVLAESWAKGGTGTREGENTNNAAYFAEQARQIIQSSVTSFNGRNGNVSPTQGDYTASQVMYSSDKTVKQEIDGKANTADLAGVATSGNADDVNYDNTDSGLTSSTAQSAIDELADLINEIRLAAYPVGSIYMSVNNTNPSTLFGGTWVAWGSGKVPVGVDTSDTDFDTVEKTGGAKSHSYTPAGTNDGTTLSAAQCGVPAHSHGLNSHTHTIGAHSHGLNSHTHSLSNHTHTGPSHSHTLGNHSHSIRGMNGGSVGGSTRGWLQMQTDGNLVVMNGTDGAIWASGTSGHVANPKLYARDIGIGIGELYTESNNGSTGSSGAGNTGGPSTNVTGASSGSTANSTAFTSGAASGSTANNTAANASQSHTHTFKGTASTQSHVQPYITCYMWKRTA